MASGAELLVSGQRAWGVINSFTDTGRTLRSRGRTPSRPELRDDDPVYVVGVDLQLPDRRAPAHAIYRRGPVHAKSSQGVPRAQVPDLAIGRRLPCLVDPAKPKHRFVIDWGDIIACGSASSHLGPEGPPKVEAAQANDALGRDDRDDVVPDEPYGW